MLVAELEADRAAELDELGLTEALVEAPPQVVVREGGVVRDRICPLEIALTAVQV